MKAFSLITRNAPEHRDSWFQLAMLLWNAGRADEAVGALQKYVALDEGSYGAWRTLAKAQAASGKPKDAIAPTERGMTAAWSPALVGDFAWLSPPIRTRRSVTGGAPSSCPGNWSPGADRTSASSWSSRRRAPKRGSLRRLFATSARPFPPLPPPSEAPLRHLIEDLEKQQPIRAEPRFP